MLLALAAAMPADTCVAEDIHARHRSEPQVRAPGYSALKFTAPRPGTYSLPPLGPAPDGIVLDSSGASLRLHDLYGKKTVVLSFIYTSCADINGCPLASFVLKQVQNRVTEDPALAAGTRLVSLSFDPRVDTPEVMAGYGRMFRRDDFDWRFLTCKSEQALAPILEGYDQFVLRDFDEDGNYLGTISHILRVYLIDEAGQIRNIYSPSFLHADLLMADMRTLALEGR